MPKPWQPWHTTAVFVFINANLARLLIQGLLDWPGWFNVLTSFVMAGGFIWWWERHQPPKG